MNEIIISLLIGVLFPTLVYLFMLIFVILPIHSAVVRRRKLGLTMKGVAQDLSMYLPIDPAAWQITQEEDWGRENWIWYVFETVMLHTKDKRTRKLAREYWKQGM